MSVAQNLPQNLAQNPGRTAVPVLEDGVAAFQARAYDRALAVFRPLAEAGDPEAQAWLGALHAGGTGVPASLTQAFAWYRRAAEQGHGPAATNVGAMLAMGQGVVQDRAEGARWLERAAASGDAMAAYNLATLLAKGDGLPADPARAADLYRSAGQAGHYPSQARLGHLYAHGIGVARDRVEAFAWLSLAAGHGVGTALTALEAVIAEMSADEKRQGAARAQARRTEPGRLAPIPA